MFCRYFNMPFINRKWHALRPRQWLIWLCFVLRKTCTCKLARVTLHSRTESFNLTETGTSGTLRERSDTHIWNQQRAMKHKADEWQCQKCDLLQTDVSSSLGFWGAFCLLILILAVICVSAPFWLSKLTLKQDILTAILDTTTFYIWLNFIVTYNLPLRRFSHGTTK